MVNRESFGKGMLTMLPRMLVLTMALALVATSAQALTVTHGLNVEFSGATPPSSGTTPWVTASFDDSFGGPNTVRLTMSTPNLSGTEFMSQLYLNFDPTLDPTQLTFTAVDVSDSNPENGDANNGIFTGVNAFQSDGDGIYDILFDFPPPPGGGSDLFTAGETVIYDITYIAPITAASFDYFSYEGGGNGTYLAAAHIQGIGVDGLDSGWIGVVPEPSTALLLGLGLAGLGVRRGRAATR